VQDLKVLIAPLSAPTAEAEPCLRKQKTTTPLQQRHPLSLAPLDREGGGVGGSPIHPLQV